MMNRFQLTDERYPVEAFFNRPSHELFVDVLTSFSKGNGRGFDGSVCAFPKDNVEDEGGKLSDYPYIEFWNYSGDKEVHISFDEFMTYLRQAADFENKNFPADADEVNALVEKTGKYLKSIS